MVDDIFGSPKAAAQSVSPSMVVSAATQSVTPSVVVSAVPLIHCVLLPSLPYDHDQSGPDLFSSTQHTVKDELFSEATDAGKVCSNNTCVFTDQ